MSISPVLGETSIVLVPSVADVEFQDADEEVGA